ncbi:MAG: alpha/beta hydrolase [Planctomycetes bacterium]|nr:alpha/beta hydrolase [Planctomycetota bacterium]
MDCFAVGTGGFDTEYAEQGAGHPVLLLHGWAGTKRIWRFLWPELVCRFRVMAPDLPGWGGSAKPSRVSYSPEWYADWIGVFLEARQAPAATLVAHSMATMAAVIFAARHPQRVRRLVLCNPPVQGATAFPARTYVLSRPVIRWIMYQSMALRAVRRWTARDFTWVVPWDDVDVDNMRRSTYASMLRSLRRMIGGDVRPQLMGLRMPVLVVSSSKDAIVAPEQADMAEKTIAGARHVTIQDSGHCPMIERPEEFNRVVVNFISEGAPRWRPPGW